MLKLTDVRKSYKTFDFSQTALDGVSIAFRDNEFAAILGPSGSGKTTLLNIIGGLDHYDSGDLEIDGISTKKYKDSNWDTYRNNRIGFVFQSYNLISHQSVLANVELALTLGGVSKAERREKALRALEEVGLKDHVRKLPNQLSGGQMQRVAIARALINDPEILLADEPTGALDTSTSEQVMELLKSIAHDRLVIMVTHNPALADEYANRIIQLQDGKLLSDTNPFDLEKEKQREGRSPRKVEMSFFTAVSLSLSNLMTKKGRTFVTALAGSIGIIGIAAILALANGINAYIEDIEKETMSIYPLTVQRSSIDFSSLLSSIGTFGNGNETAENVSGANESIDEVAIIESLFNSQNENNMESLVVYIADNRDDIDPYVKNIQYVYDLTPQIYLANTSGGIYQVNPDTMLRNYGIGGRGVSALLGGGRGMSMFHELPGETSMYDNQYEIMAGRWPTRYDEAVLVLMPNGNVSDFLLYSLGIRDRGELKKMLEAFMNNPEGEVSINNEAIDISYADLMGVELKVVLAADRYEYDEVFNVWMDRSEHEGFMEALIEQSMDLRIVGVVMANPDASVTSLSPGVNYTPELITYLMDEAAEREIVQEQIAHPLMNVITGATFADEREGNAGTDFDFANLISVDEESIRNAFIFDTSKINLDMSGLGNLSINMNGLNGIAMPAFDLNELTRRLAGQINVSPSALTGILQNVIADFLDELAAAGVGSMTPQDFIDALTIYLARPDVQANIAAQVEQLTGQTQLTATIQETVQTYMEEILQAYMNQLIRELTLMQEQVQVEIESQIRTAMNALPTQIQSAISINERMLASAFQINMTEKEIMELLNAIMNQNESTYENNLTLLGYAHPDSPSQISFYPTNFNTKVQVELFLEQYNQEMEDSGYDDKTISYTDLVGTMMSSVTDIVDTISYALIAFVAISLIVSSIMIGVITYVSVLERKKEIGILRAIGASKKDIRRVFNAETLIIGFVAGMLGILVTKIGSLIANVIVYDLLGIKNIAQLPLNNALVLVAISMLLAFLSGLFPSSAAARKDPVEALRSE